MCPTEIIAFGDRQPEFDAINTQVIAASADSHFTHLAWVNTRRSEGGLGDMKIPIVADFDKSVATKYGVLLPGGIPLRALFIISPTGQLRQITVNDLPVGRNVDEIIRLIKAFQFVDVHGEVCPANWQPGDRTMNADPEKSKEYFSAVHGAADAAAGGSEAAASGVTDVTSAEAFTAAVAGSGLTVVDFWAPWCRNCHKISPAVSRLAAEHSGVKFVKVNTVELEGVAAENFVDALPTFQFFKAGVRVGEFKGSDIAGLTAAIKSHA